MNVTGHTTKETKKVTFEVRGPSLINDYIVDVENLPFFVDVNERENTLTLNVWGGDCDDLKIRDLKMEAPDRDGEMVEVIITDEDIKEARFHSGEVAGMTLTMKDASSKPFAWIVEGWDDTMYRMTLNDAKSVARDYFVNSTAAYGGYEYDFDPARAFEILIEREAVVETLQQYAEEWMLEQVMTVAEVAEEFGLQHESVNKAIERDQIKRVRKAGGIWLILRSEAQRVWGNTSNATRGITTWLVTVLAVLAIVSQL